MVISKDREDEKLEVHYIKGYPSLAVFIASDRDKSTAIYRRFDRLSARNLLYLQSELVELEARCDRYDAEDAEDFGRPTDEKETASNWVKFKEKAAETGNIREKNRMETALEIRAKLKEYREAIVLESALISLKPPASRILEAYRNVFHNVASSGGGYPTLGGRSSEILDNVDDLMSLHKPLEEDRLTKWLRYYLPILFVHRRTNSPLVYISERRLHTSIAIINVILAAALLFGAIYNLYYVKSNEKRLSLIAGYTVAFAICVGLLTNARRPEVFAACAAYAAVLVVFVSGNLGA
ncbi:hypothetical protein MMC14_004206 [Varicellaria rhodocarpa]|nr:hypothetical protein [Varicellaria rhodocarpa]